VAIAVGIDKLDSVLGALSLMLLAYVFSALWLARREDARKEHARQAYRAHRAENRSVRSSV